MPRYIFIDAKTGGLRGDTRYVFFGEPEFSDPIAAALTLDAGRHPPMKIEYEEVDRRSKSAMYEVYTLGPDEDFTMRMDGEEPENTPGYWIKRECTYVTSLARIGMIENTALS